MNVKIPILSVFIQKKKVYYQRQPYGVPILADALFQCLAEVPLSEGI